MSHEALSGHTCNLPSFLPSSFFMLQTPISAIVPPSQRVLPPSATQSHLSAAAGAFGRSNCTLQFLPLLRPHLQRAP